MNFIGMKVLEWVLPVVLGPIVYYVMRELLNLSAKVDDLPPIAKRFAVVLVGTVITGALSALKLASPEACVALTDAATVAAQGSTVSACVAALTAKVPLQGITAALVAMVIHAVKKQNPRA